MYIGAAVFYKEFKPRVFSRDTPYMFSGVQSIGIIEDITEKNATVLWIVHKTRNVHRTEDLVIDRTALFDDIIERYNNNHKLLIGAKVRHIYNKSLIKGTIITQDWNSPICVVYWQLSESNYTTLSHPEEEIIAISSKMDVNLLFSQRKNYKKDDVPF